MAHMRISRTIVLATLAAALMLFLPAAASARVGVGIGFYGPGPFVPYGYWGGPYGYWGGPYGYPYGPYGYYGNPLGEVKIKSPDGDAQIYINGSFAGRAHDLKRFYLAPGTYRIEQRIGADRQKERIYVVADRTIKIEFGKPGTPSPPSMTPPGPPMTPRPDAGAPPPPPPPAQNP